MSSACECFYRVNVLHLTGCERESPSLGPVSCVWLYRINYKLFLVAVQRSKGNPAFQPKTFTRD